MDRNDYRHWARRAADWSADYHDSLAERPVRPAISPGDVARLLDASRPRQARRWKRFLPISNGSCPTP